MIRKLVSSLLVGSIICLFGATLGWAQSVYSTPKEYERETAKKIEKYYEAPMLRAKVAAGELPPVEERLPEEPLVVRPYEAIGVYGGRALQVPMYSMSRYSPAEFQVAECLLMMDPEGKGITIPNVAKDWKFSKDGKTFTLYLRRGLKWSDGVPFTANDILFWWQDVVLNKELNPGEPVNWIMDGELMKVNKVDDYTVELNFARPYWSVMAKMDGTKFDGSQQHAMGQSRFNYLPKHALKKYHIKYNSKANELAKEEGFETWYQLFKSRQTYVAFPDQPSLGPWHTKEVLLDGVLYERNPYYFKVDTAGNQLPYIDQMRAVVTATKDAQLMKLMTGELDYAEEDFAIADYPFLKENAEEGGYRVFLGKNVLGNQLGYFFNQNYKKNPVLGEILRDVRFRRALSLAMNREEICQVVGLGHTTPRQATVHESVGVYKEEWGKAYTEYSPEKANALLDEMGLTKRDEEGRRIMPNGEPLLLSVYTCPSMAGYAVPVSELVTEYWGQIGVQLVLKNVAEGYFWTLISAGEQPAVAWVVAAMTEKGVVSGRGDYFRGTVGWCNDWNTWWNSNGEAGEEPPEEMKRIFKISYDLPYLPKEERDEALKELCEFQAENLFIVGTMAGPPHPVAVNSDLRNVNEKAVVGFYVFSAPRPAWLEQMFWVSKR